jgi:uncharacterized protein YaaN involved in tellurite resistance
VGTDLAELRRTVEDLDPGRKGKLTGRKLLGIIPFGNKLKNYFDSYTSAQGHIQSILARLEAARRSCTSITPRSIPNGRSCGPRWASWSR